MDWHWPIPSRALSNCYSQHRLSDCYAVRHNSSDCLHLKAVDAGSCLFYSVLKLLSKLSHCSSVVPQLIYLEEYVFKSIITLVCIILTMIALLVALFVLPETKGQHLPENLLHDEEIEKAKADK